MRTNELTDQELEEMDYFTENETIVPIKQRIIDEYKNSGCVDYECYRYTDRTHRLHTDYVRSIEIDDIQEDEEYDVFLLDEEEYAHSLLANSCVSANFFDWYGDEKAKVMIVAVK